MAPTRRHAIAGAAFLAALAGAAWAATPTGDMSLGNPKAPVKVVEYASLTCNHCAAFNNDVFPAFKAKYIDTGKVHYTLKELLTSPPQVAAAGFLMARCAGPSKYFKVVDEVFRSQDRWQNGQIKPIFVEIAKANGMTEPQFEACIADQPAQVALNERVRKVVEEDKVTGTPTFLINGKQLAGGVPTLADLDAAIAAAKPGGR
ncbi:DsbA family protein [Phenylobacterium sp.]|uniref:DsbA family protein n=1 Tax=Phenylobacterium sp. TaxID=1871053 RepID=UPI0039835A15